MGVIESRGEVRAFELNTRGNTVVSASFDFINVDGEREHVSRFKVVNVDGQRQAVIGNRDRQNIRCTHTRAVGRVEHEAVEICSPRFTRVHIEKDVAAGQSTGKVLVTVDGELRKLSRLGTAFERDLKMVRKRVTTLIAF